MLSSVSLFSVAKIDPYTSIELDLVQENRGTRITFLGHRVPKLYAIMYVNLLI